VCDEQPSPQNVLFGQLPRREYKRNLVSEGGVELRWKFVGPVIGSRAASGFYLDLFFLILFSFYRFGLACVMSDPLHQEEFFGQLPRKLEQSDLVR